MNIRIVLAFFVTVFIIVVYGTLRCKIGFTDPLIHSLLGPPLDKYTDGWAFTHFVFYGYLAYSFPEPRNLAFVWVSGVVWELVECVFRERPFYISDCSKGVTAHGKEGWWYGRWQDVVVNTIGMAVGYTLRKHMT